MKRNFLVVAADARLREVLATELSAQGHNVIRAAGGGEALRVAESVSLDVALIESNLSDTTPEKLRRGLAKARPDCRVVVVTNFERIRNSPAQLQCGRDDFLIRGDQVVELLRLSADVEADGGAIPHHRKTDALIRVIDVLVGLIELDDKFFGGSSHKVMRLARQVVEELSNDAEAIQELVLATLLRDIGKVGVETDVLSAEGQYSEEQKQRMREHVGASLRLFEHVDFPWKVLPIIRHHHERYDGGGYPDGLRGREIPLGARIIAVVDAYVALTSNRSHRKAIDPEEALRELIGQAGRQFDPEVIEAFQKVLDKQLAGRGAGKGKPRALLIEAQEDFRRLLKMRLLNEGLDVDDAASCEQALERLLKEPPDLVLCDLDVDSAEAFQLFQEMRDDETLRRVPFAFLSRKGDRVLKIRALRLGVDEFLDKTSDLEELVARVENVLTREALRRDGAARRTRRGIHGDLENLSLPDIVQTLAMGMKTACLSVASEERQGKIFFENGTAKHAKTNGLDGEEAFYEMVRWTSGEFIIEHGVRPPQGNLDQDPMFLLMEGLRRLDESQHEAASAAS